MSILVFLFTFIMESGQIERFKLTRKKGSLFEEDDAEIAKLVQRSKQERGVKSPRGRPLKKDKGSKTVSKAPKKGTEEDKQSTEATEADKASDDANLPAKRRQVAAAEKKKSTGRAVGRPRKVPDTATASKVKKAKSPLKKKQVNNIAEKGVSLLEILDMSIANGGEEELEEEEEEFNLAIEPVKIPRVKGNNMVETPVESVSNPAITLKPTGRRGRPKKAGKGIASKKNAPAKKGKQQPRLHIKETPTAASIEPENEIPHTEQGDVLEVDDPLGDTGEYSESKTALRVPHADLETVRRSPRKSRVPRRQSLASRGRRLSNVLGPPLLPHEEVPISAFHSHLDPMLPTPHKLKTLLGWVCRRLLAKGKCDEDKVRALLQAVEGDNLDVDWWGEETSEVVDPATRARVEALQGQSQQLEKELREIERMQQKPMEETAFEIPHAPRAREVCSPEQEKEIAKAETRMEKLNLLKDRVAVVEDLAERVRERRNEIQARKIKNQCRVDPIELLRML